MPYPVIRIAPKPNRFTLRSPPRSKVPAADAFGRASRSVMVCSSSLKYLRCRCFRLPGSVYPEHNVAVLWSVSTCRRICTQPPRAQRVLQESCGDYGAPVHMGRGRHCSRRLASLPFGLPSSLARPDWRHDNLSSLPYIGSQAGRLAGMITHLFSVGCPSRC
jgi:hypothetical protein